ncbi:hypothetical protein ACIQCF_07620 [Streptomyces sp. NPDC088353]|uniref:hypothetical protein n=1 Tax=Streptomyces sp. NPDC088353 TaxID=3365855 RepID=UPI00380CB3E0
MSTVVHSINGHPHLRISRLVELLVIRQRLVALDETRQLLPLGSPDRHDLDPVDAAYGRMPIRIPDAAVIARRRRTALLRAVRAEGGRWKTGRAIRLYQRLGYGLIGHGTAARDLLALSGAGHLVRHETDGARYFTPAGDRSV